MFISSTRAQVSSKLRPHLPKTVSSQGNTAEAMSSACAQYLSDVRAGRTPAHDPYPAEMKGKEKIRLSESLNELAREAQADFAAQKETAGAPLRLPQLHSALESLQVSTQRSLEETQGMKKSLKRGYHKQVAKTIGWMAGTAAALVVGGILPNPLSVLGVGFLATMTVRSIGKARAAQKNLAAQLPRLNDSLKSSREVLANTVAFAPHVLAWDQALQPASQPAFAA